MYCTPALCVFVISIVKKLKMKNLSIANMKNNGISKNVTAILRKKAPRFINKFSQLEMCIDMYT